MSICISDDPYIERDIRQNFLCPECEAEGYKLRMLESNKIPGLLQLKVAEEDGQMHLLYDISSRQSLRNILVTRVLSREQVENFVFCLNRILLSIEGYLLDAGDLVMRPEYIYVTEDMEPALCCVPDYCGDFTGALSDVLRDMLGAVDQRDHRAVVLTYRLYQKTLEPHYVMKDLMDILEGGEPRREPEAGDRKEKTVSQAAPMEEIEVSEPSKTVPADKDELFDLMAADAKRSRKKKKRFFLF